MRTRGQVVIKVMLPIILGLLVIAVMLFGAGKTTVEFFKEKFLGEKGIFARPPASEFEPYKGSQLAADDVLALDSMHALQCASDAIALGGILGPDGSPIPGCGTGGNGGALRQVKGRQVCYGKACASCTGMPSSTIHLTDDHKANVLIVTNAITACKLKASRMDLGKGEYFRCAFIDPGASRQPITWDEVNARLAIIDPDKQFGRWFKSIEWDDDILDVSTLRYCIYYDKDWTSWDDVAVGKCPEGVVTDFHCTVEGFNLPQQVSYDASSLLYPPAWLAGYGDPKYLAYFESFPEGAAEGWHVDSFEFGAHLLLLSGAINMMGMPAGGTAIKRAASELGEKGIRAIGRAAAKGVAESAKDALRKATTEAVQTLASMGERNAMKSILLTQTLRTAKVAAGELDETFLTLVAKNLKQGFRKYDAAALDEMFTKNIGAQLEKQAVESMAANPALASARREMLDKLEKAYLAQGMAKEEAMRLAEQRATGMAAAELRKKYKSAFIAAFTQDAESAAARQALKDESKIAFISTLIRHGAAGINEKAVKSAAKKAVDRLSFKTTADAASAVARADKSLLRQLGEGAYRGTLGNAPPWRPTRFLAEQIPLTFGRPALKDIATAPALGKYLTRLAGRNAVKAGRWVKGHKYPMMLLLMLAAEEFDKSNEKYVPLGLSTLGLFSPVGEGEPRAFGLDQQARKFFMSVKDENNEKFYLASPCAATLELRQSQCMCSRDPDSWHFNFGGGQTDVKPNTIRIDDAKLKAYFNAMFDKKLESGVYEKDPAFTSTDVEGYRQKQFESYKRAVENYHTNIIQGGGTAYVEETGLFGWGTGEVAQYFAQEQHMEAWDLSRVVRDCAPPTNWAFGALKTGFGNGYEYWLGGERPSKEGYNQWKRPRQPTACIRVSIDKDKDAPLPNYCANICPTCTKARVALFGVSLAADMLATTASAATGPFAPVVAPAALFATGVGSALAETQIAEWEKWPGDKKWGEAKQWFKEHLG